MICEEFNICCRMNVCVKTDPAENEPHLYRFSNVFSPGAAAARDAAGPRRDAGGGLRRRGAARGGRPRCGGRRRGLRRPAALGGPLGLRCGYGVQLHEN